MANSNLKKPKAKIGIIGGTGFYGFFEKEKQEVEVKTKFGKPSDKITVGEVDGKRVAFVPRHSRDHNFPPHKIPYRANIAALKKLGVERIIAPTAVGSLKTDIEPGDFVICDQFIDRTKKRKDTFFEGPEVAHIESAYPYCDHLRKIAIEQANELKLKNHPKGTVVVIEGPRFSTTEESTWFSKMDWDLVNMTQYPEIILALEAGICYLNISLVTDYDAGVYAKTKQKPVSVEEVLENFNKNLEKLKKLTVAIIKNIPKNKDCDCREKSKRAVIN